MYVYSYKQFETESYHCIIQIILTTNWPFRTWYTPHFLDSQLCLFSFLTSNSSILNIFTAWLTNFHHWLSKLTIQETVHNIFLDSQLCLSLNVLKHEILLLTVPVWALSLYDTEHSDYRLTYHRKHDTPNHHILLDSQVGDKHVFLHSILVPDWGPSRMRQFKRQLLLDFDHSAIDKLTIQDVNTAILFSVSKFVSIKDHCI